jgi:hypothetical protein
MNMGTNHSRTVLDALAEFRATGGIDGQCATAATWTCRFGPVVLRLPNFQWRREAIQRHDLHHILTGYPCTMRGEFQMATWEFAAGRFPHPAATLFCLPLVAMGAVWSPTAIWRAFLAGRYGRSLYKTELSEDFLRTPIEALQAVQSSKPAMPQDLIAFCGLLLHATLVTLAPIGAALLAALLI